MEKALPEGGAFSFQKEILQVNIFVFLFI